VVARLTGVDAAMLAVHHRAIDPAFDAIIRWSKDGDAGRDATPRSRKSAADKKTAVLAEGSRGNCCNGHHAASA
jgi:hypothetical protein